MLSWLWQPITNLVKQRPKARHRNLQTGLVHIYNLGVLGGRALQNPDDGDWVVLWKDGWSEPPDMATSSRKRFYWIFFAKKIISFFYNGSIVLIISTIEPLYVISMKYSSSLPDDGSYVIRNMLEYFNVCLLGFCII